MTYGNALHKISGTNTCHSIKFVNKQTCTSNHMFKGEFWDKFTEFTFFENYEIENLKKVRDWKISKNERGKFSQNFTNKHVIPG